MARVFSIGSKGQYQVIVDDEDFEFLTQRRWTFAVSHPQEGSGVYARYSVRDGERGNVTVFMHHVVLDRVGKKRPSAKHTADHINQDTLDNRRDNLRWATRRQQAKNKRKPGHMVRRLASAAELESIPF